MEDKLKNLRSTMDETTFKDGEFTEQDKISVREKIEQHEQGQSFNIFKRFGSWFKPVLSVAVCLLLFIGGVYIVNHQDNGENSKQESALLDKAGEFPYPELLSDKVGKFYVLEVGNQRKLKDQADEIERVLAGYSSLSLKQARHKYPKLDIQTAPYYLVFSTKGEIFSLETAESVVEFLSQAVFQYPKLLSEEAGKVSYLAIGGQNGAFNDFQKVISHGKDLSLSAVQNKFPKLHVDKSPTYIFFDQNKDVFHTGDVQEARQFLKAQSNQLESDFPYKDLLSDKPGKLTFLLVYDSKYPKFMNEVQYLGQVFMRGEATKSLSYTKTKYPELNIKKSPTYFFFDTRGITLRTHSGQEAEEFLRNQFQFDKFETALDRANVQNSGVIWVEKYDTNYDEVDDEDRVTFDEAFIVFKAKSDLIGVGRLVKQNESWQWIKDSGSFLEPEDDFVYDTLPTTQKRKFIYGVSPGKNLSKIEVNDIRAKTIQLDSGVTFWYLDIYEPLDKVIAYGKDGSILFSKTDLSVEKDQTVFQRIARFYANESGTHGRKIVYSDEQLRKIALAGNAGSLKQIYLPIVGIAGDYLMEVRINKQKGLAQLIYPHFEITLADHPFTKVPIVKTKSANLEVGPGKWMITDAESGLAYLRVHLNDTYIVIDSSKIGKRSQFKTIAESLTHINEVASR